MTIERRIVLVEGGADAQSRELLNWALVKVAEPGDSVTAFYHCKDSDSFFKEKAKLAPYLKDYGGLCELKKVALECKLFAGLSMRRALVGEAAITAAAAVVVGSDEIGGLRGRLSTARYCAKHLPAATDVWCILNGKIVYSRVKRECVSGPLLVKRPSLRLLWRHFSMDFQSEPCDSSYVTGARRTVSLFDGDKHDRKPGWPLLANPSQILENRDCSVVEWVMNLPDRSIHQNPQHRNLYAILRCSNVKWLSYEKLKLATSGFHPDNLIGNGATNRVYRGILDGKQVAVRIQKASEEARKNFSLEIEIVTSFKHKSIADLVGISMEDASLISVYDYKSGGTLAENLQGNKRKSPLPWEVRHKIAVEIAEAVNYFHNECPKPVIHRDIKSSNILLSDDFVPQLSDFGLAIWGPKTGSSSFITETDVVGTFGYIAPEYFMHGEVSDKNDVYAYGVVLLELLTGRKPIYYNSKSRESLILWANPLLESDDPKRLLDPDLVGNFDEEQFKRMRIAARLCVSSSPKLRPKMDQILQLLRGERSSFWNLQNHLHQGDDGDDGDDVHPICRADLHLNLAMLGVDDDSSSPEQINRHNSELLKGR